MIRTLFFVIVFFVSTSYAVPEKTQTAASEEELPLRLNLQKDKKESSFSSVKLFVSLFVLLSAAGGIGFVYFKRMNRPQARKGTRKYLIENMSYCSLTPKCGVSLVKVGEEFVLLGVTPDQVSFLSALPKLQAQYEQEALLERDVFKKVVQSEYDRVKIQTV